MKLAFLEMHVPGIVAVRVADPPRIADWRHECPAFCGARGKPSTVRTPIGLCVVRLEVVVLGFGYSGQD
jgi:hypothetical protein